MELNLRPHPDARITSQQSICDGERYIGYCWQCVDKRYNERSQVAMIVHMDPVQRQEVERFVATALDAPVNSFANQPKPPEPEHVDSPSPIITNLSQFFDDD